jgi:hypothetical protein
VLRRLRLLVRESLVKMLLMFLALLMLAGCAAKRKVGVDYLIAASCLTAPVRLVDCNQSDPPHCKTSTVKYRAGCEQIVVRQKP